MNPDPLAQMKDIVVPTFQASYWPLALGYWLLIAVSIGLVVFGLFTYRKKTPPSSSHA